MSRTGTEVAPPFLRAGTEESLLALEARLEEIRRSFAIEDLLRRTSFAIQWADGVSPGTNGGEPEEPSPSRTGRGPPGWSAKFSDLSRRDDPAIGTKPVPTIVAQWADPNSLSNAMRMHDAGLHASTPLVDAPTQNALCGNTMRPSVMPHHAFCGSVEWWGCSERDTSQFTTL